MVDPQQILEILDTRLNLDDLNTDALGKHALENLHKTFNKHNSFDWSRNEGKCFSSRWKVGIKNAYYIRLIFQKLNKTRTW